MQFSPIKMMLSDDDLGTSWSISMGRGEGGGGLEHFGNHWLQNK